LCTCTCTCTCNMQHATCNMQHATCNMQHATCNMQHATCNMHTHEDTLVCGMSLEADTEFWQNAPQTYQVGCQFDAERQCWAVLGHPWEWALLWWAHGKSVKLTEQRHLMHGACWCEVVLDGQGLEKHTKLKMTNDNSSPSNQPNKGWNVANNTLMKKLSCSNVSPKEQMLLHAILKVMSVTLPQK